MLESFNHKCECSKKVCKADVIRKKKMHCHVTGVFILTTNTYVLKNGDFQPQKYINTKVLKLHHLQELILIRYAKFASPKINLQTVNIG